MAMGKLSWRLFDCDEKGIPICGGGDGRMYGPQNRHE